MKQYLGLTVELMIFFINIYVWVSADILKVRACFWGTPFLGKTFCSVSSGSFRLSAWGFLIINLWETCQHLCQNGEKIVIRAQYSAFLFKSSNVFNSEVKKVALKYYIIVSLSLSNLTAANDLTCLTVKEINHFIDVLVLT